MPDATTDLAALQKRLTRLEAQVAALLRLLQLKDEELADARTRLNLRVATLAFSDEAGDFGWVRRDKAGHACLGLFGLNGHDDATEGGPERRLAALYLRAGDPDEGANLRLHTTGAHAGVTLGSDAGGHGHVSVFAPGGVARAAVKSLPTTGAFIVAAPDGGALAVLTGTSGTNQGNGQLLLFNAAGDPGVDLRVTADGGMIGVQSPGDPGRPVALLSAHDGHGALLLKQPDGDHGVTLMSTDDGGALILGAPAGPEGDVEGVILTAGATGSTLELRTADGEPVIQLAATAAGGSLHVNDAVGDLAVGVDAHESGGRVRVCAGPDGKERLVLHVHDGQHGAIGIRDAQGGLRLLATAIDNGAALGLMTPDSRPGIFLETGGDPGGMLTIAPRDPAHGGVNLGIFGQGGGMSLQGPGGVSRVLLGPEPENPERTVFLLKDAAGDARIALSTHPEHGGRIHLYGSNGDDTAQLPEEKA